MSADLAPCPFCGSTNVSKFATYIRCDDCNADGPAEDHSASAEDYWNRRAQPVAAIPEAGQSVTKLTDDQLYDFWLYRDCMDAIRAGDMRGHFISAVRAVLATMSADAPAVQAGTAQGETK